MTKTETLLRALLGPVREDIRPLAAVVDYVAGLLFVEEMQLDDVRITKRVYPAVAKQLGKPATAIRSFCRPFWDVRFSRPIPRGKR